MRRRDTLAIALLLIIGGRAWSAQPGYADPSSCAGCHPKAAEGYARSGMARTFGVVRASVSEPARPGEFRDNRSEQAFTVSRQNGQLTLRRSTVGHDGKPADVFEAEMSHWIGSGNHARTYLSRRSSGKLVELPLTWYSAGGGNWAMSPGYSLPFHAGFSRKITYGCVFCHAAYPDLPAGTDSDEGGWKLPDSAVVGIDCQRCHGPGQAHVDLAERGQPADSVRAAIVNPKKLDPSRGMEVCMQCHLETTNARLPGFVRKYGRGVFSYRAGEPLTDYMLHFEAAQGTGRQDRLEFVGEAYRLRMSACFRESNGALTCMRCHNPHDIPRGEQTAGYYNKICQGCHSDVMTRGGQHSTVANCVGCHMAKRRPVDALETMVTDHFIRKQPGSEPSGTRAEYNDSTAPPYRGALIPYYPAPLPDTPENELYLAVAQVRDGANVETGLPRLEALVRQMPARGEFDLDLADAFRHAGQPDSAVVYARQAIQRMPENSRAWFALGNTLIAAGKSAEAITALQRAAALAPEEPAAAQTLGEAYGRQGRFTEALGAFRSAVAADPDFAEGHNNLGTSLLRMGDIVGAEKELREAVRLRPESSAMQVNLAAFLARRGGMPEARRRFELALKLNPGYADGHAAYGAALAQQREWTAARRELEDAIRLNPKAPVTRHNLGVVLLEFRDTQAALEEFRAAVALDSVYYEAHLQLGMLLVRLGRPGDAEPHLRKAAESPDPGVKQAATKALNK